MTLEQSWGSAREEMLASSGARHGGGDVVQGVKGWEKGPVQTHSPSGLKAELSVEKKIDSCGMYSLLEPQ